MDELLSIRGLTVRFHTYEGVVQALENLDLDVERGETFGLVGETGCGKTMAALSILRLVPPPGRIESGSIYFKADGEDELTDLLVLSEDEIRGIRGSKISMVFQEPSVALNPVFTIGDQILEVILAHRQQELAERAMEVVTRLAASREGFIGLLTRPLRLVQMRFYQRVSQNRQSLLLRATTRIPLVRKLLWRLNNEAEKIVINALREVGIPDAERVLRQYPHQLSGGMKQRAVIATALACSPRFLIADEPTTSLDVTIQAQILELFRRLKAETEASILYITHDLAVAAELCDRVGVMYAGGLCEIAGVDKIYDNPLHPYTRALMAAVPKPDQEPQTISGVVPDPINPPPGCKFHPRCSHAMQTCQEQPPQMCQHEPGHLVACHLYQGETGGRSR